VSEVERLFPFIYALMLANDGEHAARSPIPATIPLR
jgi:hypothetical protein